MSVIVNDAGANAQALIRFNWREGNKSQSKAVNFQFPPKVTADNRRGNWEEKEIWGIEPLAIYKGSTSRNITLQLTYICDGEWTCSKIKEQVTLIRGYFMRAAGSGVHQDNLIVDLKLWCIGGDDYLTFRLRSVDVKYSETMVTERTAAGTGSKQIFFPLRTDITLDLASWTSKTNANAFKRADAAPQTPNLPGQPPAEEGTVIQNINGMKLEMPEDWY